MLDRLDWRFRHWTQSFLNWGGKKFGWTRKGVLINTIILNSVSFLYLGLANFQMKYFVMEGFLLLFGILIRVFWFGLLIALEDRKDGPETIWEVTEWFRKAMIVFMILPILSAILLPEVEDIIRILEHYSFVVAFYISSCENPPPKEAKKKLVHSHAWG